MPKPNLSVVHITPSIAEELLKKNKANRPVRNKRVQHLTRIIMDGQWVLNNDAITVSSEGVLMNGQHRLHAVIRANKGVDMVLLTDANPRAFQTMDIGAHRSMCDLTHLPYGLATDATTLYGLTKGAPTAVVTSDDVLDVAVWWKPAYDALAETYRTGGRGRGPLDNTAIRVGFGLRWAITTDTAKRSHLLSQYKLMHLGQVRDLDESILALREKFTTRAVRIISRQERAQAAAMVLHFTDPARKDRRGRMPEGDAAMSFLISVVKGMEPAWAEANAGGHPYAWMDLPKVEYRLRGIARTNAEAKAAKEQGQ